MNVASLSPIAHALVVFSVIGAAGLWIGRVKIFGVPIGITGVLFAGILVGHAGVVVHAEILEFTRELGLIFFVYSIGQQVGPGFFASLRKQGILLNSAAVCVVAGGALLTIMVEKFGGVPSLAALGLYSGAVTNTPSLGAAQQMLKSFPLLTPDDLKMPGIGYALGYPFGILGSILTMLALSRVFRTNLQDEADLYARAETGAHKTLKTLNLEVQNQNLEGRSLAEIPGLSGSGVVISRVWHAEELQVAGPHTRLHLGDVLLAVGPADKLASILLAVGKESHHDLRGKSPNVVARRALVTRSQVVGQTLSSLNLTRRYGVVVTRVIRADVELPATPHLELQFGDGLLLVGSDADVIKASNDVGNSPAKLQEPPVLPMFIGIGLGVMLGSVPIPVPGVDVPIRLGLAGGPLVAAMLLARIGKVGNVIWYLPEGSRHMLRELGIVLFLSCVGVRAGHGFWQTFISGGWEWMLWGTLITVLPLLSVGFVLRRYYRVNHLSLCGWIAGCVTGPAALAFAGQLARSEAPMVAYATVYPLVMLLRVVTAQLLAVFLL